MALSFKQKNNFGPIGLAEVRVLKEKVKILWEDGDVDELPLEAWDENRKAGNYMVGLNKERSDIAFLKPPGGQTWYCKFGQFKRDGQSETPEPYIEPGGPRKNKDGGTWIADDEMRAKYELVILDPDGLYDGLTLVGNIPYIFEQKAGTKEVEMVGKKGQLARIEKFLRVTGFDFVNDTLQYSPNVLPQLEYLLQSKGAIFSVTTSDKGFIAEMAEVPARYLPEGLKNAQD